MAGFTTPNHVGSRLSLELTRLDFGVRDLTCFCTPLRDLATTHPDGLLPVATMEQSQCP